MLHPRSCANHIPERKFILLNTLMNIIWCPVYAPFPLLSKKLSLHTIKYPLQAQWACCYSMDISVLYKLSRGVEIACWLELWTHDWKVANSNPSRNGGRIFFSRVKCVCWLLFSVRSTLVLPQWHVKDHGHFAKSTDGRLHLITHILLTQGSQSGLTMLLSWRSVGTFQDTS